MYNYSNNSCDYINKSKTHSIVNFSAKLVANFFPIFHFFHYSGTGSLILVQHQFKTTWTFPGQLQCQKPYKRQKYLSQKLQPLETGDTFFLLFLAFVYEIMVTVVHAHFWYKDIIRPMALPSPNLYNISHNKNDSVNHTHAVCTYTLPLFLQTCIRFNSDYLSNEILLATMCF